MKLRINIFHTYFHSTPLHSAISQRIHFLITVHESTHFSDHNDIKYVEMWEYLEGQNSMGIYASSRESV